jgi:hypothetical protein
MIALLEGGRVDEDLNLLRKQRLGSPARSAMTAALTRARERGEIPRAVDTEMLLELPLAMVLSHVLIIGDGADLDLADRIVDGILVPLLESPKPVPH